jgi:hypothetical protein
VLAFLNFGFTPPFAFSRQVPILVVTRHSRCIDGVCGKDDNHSLLPLVSQVFDTMNRFPRHMLRSLNLFFCFELLFWVGQKCYTMFLLFFFLKFPFIPPWRDKSVFNWMAEQDKLSGERMCLYLPIIREKPIADRPLSQNPDNSM